MSDGRTRSTAAAAASSSATKGVNVVKNIQYGQDAGAGQATGVLMPKNKKIAPACYL